MNLAHGGDIFAVARERGWDWREVLDFSASINPLGLAPGVREAINDAIERVVHYPERHSVRLAGALGEHWDIDPERILIGNGATELIHFIARVWPQPETTLVVPTFSEFHRAYPEASWAPAESPDSWPEEGLLILTRPNSPTGLDMYVPDGRSGPVMIDESFIEFTHLESAISMGGDIVLRSLTKIYALPGLRAGAVVGPADLIRKWREMQDPWQVNVLAEAAALASIAQPEYVERTREFISAERARLFGIMPELQGVTALKGCANFVFVKLEYPAVALCEYLLDHKILLRHCTGWIGTAGETVRFSIRTREENDRLIELWKAFSWES
jgi:threonine-phosphate decarboxylase